MDKNIIREIAAAVRLNSIKAELEKYNCVPVLLIGVNVDNAGIFAFALDEKLTQKDCLEIIEAAATLLKDEIKNPAEQG